MALELNVEGQLNVDNGTAQAIETHATGEVDFPSQSAAKVYLSANQDIPTDTVTTVVWDAEDYDINSDHDTGTGIFTCPTAGRYLVFASARLDEALTDGEFLAVEVAKNGTRVSYGVVYASGTLKTLCPATSIVNCAVDDELSVRILHNAGVARELKADRDACFADFSKIA